jgi:hypothetical protein
MHVQVDDAHGNGYFRKLFSLGLALICAIGTVLANAPCVFSMFTFYYFRAVLCAALSIGGVHPPI